jgi:signal transduction histidine kinase
MKILKLVKTIRFRLTLWYVTFVVLLLFALILSVNLVMLKYHAVLPPSPSQIPTDFQSWSQTLYEEGNNIVSDLRHYSVIGAGIVIIVGAVGGYFLSGKMLRPVAKVTLLAESISYTNLKQRLNYSGPNDEIKHLADTFDKMLARLENAAQSQKQFIQDASHELRTPIATALTNIEVLEMNSQATVEDYQNLSKILKLSLSRMNNISNSLLLLSEDVVSSQNWSKVALTGIITEIVNEFSTEAQRQGIGLVWNSQTPKTTILGDSYRIRQVIFNLVDNALKYNRPGGSVTLSLNNQDRSVILEVADTGIGIGSEDLPRIFDRFFRVDKSRSRRTGGSGLGLAIVKKIVEEHSGTVSVESALGQGSSFYVTLPLI